jgi:hypothetical protein
LLSFLFPDLLFRITGARRRLVLFRDQAELLGSGAVAGVLLELHTAGGRSPGSVDAQAGVVGYEVVVAVGLEVGAEERIGVGGTSVLAQVEIL